MRNPRNARILRWLAVALFLACGLQAQSSAPPTAVPDGDVVGAPPPLDLSWSGLGDDGSVVPLAASTIDLRVENRGGTFGDLVLEVLADDGGARRVYRELDPVELAPGESAWIPVDLASFDFDLASMAFSGQVLATARLREPGGAEPDPHLAIAMPLYFHLDPTGAMQVYGETALVSLFGGGDLQGAAPPLGNVVPARIRGTNDGGGDPPMAPESGTIPGAPDETFTAPDPTIPSTRRRLCVKWEITVADKGRVLLDQDGDPFSEDYWNGIPAPGSETSIPGPTSNLLVTARGVWITLMQGDWQEILHTDPQTGCVDIDPPRESPIDVAVWTLHEDKDGNRMKLATGENSLFPFAFVELGVDPPTLGETKNIAVGDYTSRATLAAVSGFAAYRTHFGLADKEIRILETTCAAGGTGNTSSAHNQPVADLAFSQGRARITIHRGGASPCSTLDHRSYKFIITHEIGHAWMLLARGADEFEPKVDLTLSDLQETVCSFGAGYSANSLEFDAVGGREGMAHFYAARVWNHAGQEEAMFTWFGAPNSLEPPLDPGGRLWNVCDTPTKCGRGTNIDWARFWWNWHTPYQAGATPRTVDLRDVYVQRHNNGGLERDNYYRKSKTAMFQVIGNTSWQEDWKTDAFNNGIGEACVGAYTYPACDCWADRDEPMPASCRGELGCPCADVDPVLWAEDLLSNPDASPDGGGSYLENGAQGPGQHCVDWSGEATCAALDWNGEQVPVCRTCDEGTRFGCSCMGDTDCEGIPGDGALACHGAPENGWAGSSPGVCLPAANDAVGREKLEEVPWFCLDNCGSKGSGFACLYDQLKNHPGEVNLEHAQCVDVFGDAPAGFCEFQPGGYVALPNAECTSDDYMECCQAECGPVPGESCQDWGYPESYVCDAENVQPGNCVPSECANPKNFPAMLSYCRMYW